MSMSQVFAETRKREHSVKHNRYIHLAERVRNGKASRSEQLELRRLEREGHNLSTSAFPPLF